MMPPQLPRTRIDRALRREEHVLPARLARRIRKLARQRVRQPDFTEAFRQVDRMLQAGALDGRLQRLAQAQRQWHPAILAAFSVAHHDLATPEVDILHPPADAFGPPHPGPLQQPRPTPPLPPPTPTAKPARREKRS